MISAEYKEVYVGIVIKPASEILNRQAELCELLNLIPRPELHLTLAYIGTVDSSKVKELKYSMSTIASRDFSGLKVSGVGGAYEEEG